MELRFVLQVLFGVTILLSIIDLGIAAGGKSKAGSCLGVDFSLGSDTAGMTISTSIFSIFAIAYAFFLHKTNNNGQPFLLGLLAAVVILEIFWLVSWALFARDVDDLRHLPLDCKFDTVNAGLAFTLFTWFAWTAITVLTFLDVYNYIGSGINSGGATETATA
eukprot:TRINITY_DN1836_c0_g1_i1.p1 TRINITY_DN1836_c0_g1~~TRINITY_DN1836_c0_g1_i1.p1  ORF type:complete len:163 (+),score=14.92 TRINITY_DN1836_c0_g1_i1:64-552(+)